MNLFRFAPLLLAAALQLLPLGRVLVTSQFAAPSGFAVVFRWAVGAVALLGSYHAVSGASTLIKSPITAKGTNGVAFLYAIKAGPDVPNWYDAAPLPPGLAVSHASGRITGTPSQVGVFTVLLTASDTQHPEYTVSTNLTLTIIDKPVAGTAPSITTQPASQTVNAGANVSFTVVASGTAPLSYQWKKGTSLISGALAATLTLTNVTAADAGSYSVVVSNSVSAVPSDPAVLTVQVPPTITTQPQDQAVPAGGTATFTVAATGTGPLSYQWKFNNEVLTNATAASLTLTNLPATSAGDYLVVVSNPAGTTNSLPAHLTVQVASTSALLLATPGLVNGAFALHVTGPAGTNFVIWTTSDLVQWTPISTNAAADGTLDITDPALVSQRFFRATLGH